MTSHSASLSGTAEKSLGSRVEDDNVLIVIHRDDGAHGGIEDAGQTSPVIAYRLFECAYVHSHPSGLFHDKA